MKRKDDDGEVVSWRAIRSSDDQIIQLGILKDDPATDLVVDYHLTVQRIFETNYRVNTIAYFRALTAAAVIANSVSCIHLLFA